MADDVDIEINEDGLPPTIDGRAALAEALRRRLARTDPAACPDCGGYEEGGLLPLPAASCPRAHRRRSADPWVPPGPLSGSYDSARWAELQRLAEVDRG